jgi:hypothetical protein
MDNLGTSARNLLYFLTILSSFLLIDSSPLLSRNKARRMLSRVGKFRGAVIADAASFSSIWERPQIPVINEWLQALIFNGHHADGVELLGRRKSVAKCP